MNLRHLNPYVDSCINDWQKMCHLYSHASREAAPCDIPTPQKLAGTSSFGMSGVNAHALIKGSGTVGQECRYAKPSTIRKEWLWCLTPAYYILGKNTPARTVQKSTFMLSTCKPELAYLKDYKVNTH